MNAYEVLKLLHPIKTIPKTDVNIQKLVMERYPKQYIQLFLFTFDWDDLDGVLDFLYGEHKLGILCQSFGVPKSDVTEIIDLIESNSEIKKL